MSKRNHDDLSFAAPGNSNRLSDLMVESDLKSAYFAAVSAAHQAFGVTLRSKMMAATLVATTPSKVLSDRNGTPFWVPSDPNDTLDTTTTTFMAPALSTPLAAPALSTPSAAPPFAPPLAPHLTSLDTTTTVMAADPPSTISVAPLAPPLASHSTSLVMTMTPLTTVVLSNPNGTPLWVLSDPNDTLDTTTILPASLPTASDTTTTTIVSPSSLSTSSVFPPLAAPLAAPLFASLASPLSDPDRTTMTSVSCPPSLSTSLVPPVSLASRPPAHDTRRRAIPFVGNQPHSRRSHFLTNSDGLVTMSKVKLIQCLRGRFSDLLNSQAVDNLPSCFELPSSMEEYRLANSSNRLDNQGAFSRRRWKFMSEIHVAFPCREGHLYLAKRADVPHYQGVFSNFIAELERYEDDINVYLYLPKFDYDNHFLIVRNTPMSVHRFAGKIDWVAVHRLATAGVHSKQKEKTTDKKRQKVFVDNGFTGGQCTSRRGSSNGISEPVLKPETTQDCATVEAYLHLSEFLRSCRPKWSWRDEPLYHDPANLDHQAKFAGRIHSRNLFECMRMSVTDLASHCGCHSDDSNSFLPLFSAVAGCSVIRRIDGKDVRVAINAQSRKSIDDSLARSKKFGPLLRMVADEYASIGDNRKFISTAMFDGVVAKGVEGFVCIRNPCNMDPFGYYQPFLHFGLLLVKHYQLSFPETVGMVTAMEVVPNTSYFFALAAQSLLQVPANHLHPSHRGFAFGYLVSSLMLEWRETQSRQSPGIRWNLYRVPVAASGEEWESRCKVKTLSCLQFYASFNDLVCKKERKTQYKKLLAIFCSETPDCRVLTTNHMLAISSCLGLLPSWVRDKIEVSPTSRYMKWLAKGYNLTMTKETAQQITKSLVVLLSHQFGGHFSKRKIENILCKVYCRMLE